MNNISKQTAIFSLLFIFMFGWNCYLTYTLKRDFKDAAIAINAVDDKMEDFIHRYKVNELINTTTKRQYNNPFNNNEELEKRVQMLETQTREQQQKIKNNELDVDSLENRMWLDNYERNYKSKRGF